MGIEKLLGKLEKHLDKGESGDEAVRCERIDDLLDKLGKKKQKLGKKLEKESDKRKRKQLSMELRIVSLELKKGRKRRKELASKCR